MASTNENLEQRMQGMVESFQAAAETFYAVKIYYGSRAGDSAKTKELLEKVVEAMPVFGQAVSLIAAIPPHVITGLVDRGAIHRSVVTEDNGQSGALKPSHRLDSSLSVLYINYLKGELSPDHKNSQLYNLDAYTFENLSRICSSARNVCRSLQSVSTTYWV